MAGLIMTILVGLAFLAQGVTAQAEEVKKVSSEARAFKMMQKHNMAMVATVVKEKGEHLPFSSIMGYALDEKGRPFVFISDLAVHTDNINKNPNVSLMIFVADKDGNVFNGARVTFNGKFKKIEDEEAIKKLRKSYLNKHEDAEEFIDFGDFNFYVLEPDDIYFIGGFGDIGYLDNDKYMREAQK